MSAKQKIAEELKSLGTAMLFFGIWFAVLLLLKQLILAEYKIAFAGISKALVGALILGKVVLILEHVPLGSWISRQAAWVDVLVRTSLYSVGVLVVMLLEKGFEGRHEHGGFGPAVEALFREGDLDHVWVNTICVSGALLIYNALAVVKAHLGQGSLLNLFRQPIPRSPDLE